MESMRLSLLEKATVSRGTLKQGLAKRLYKGAYSEHFRLCVPNICFLQTFQMIKTILSLPWLAGAYFKGITEKP